PREIGDDLVIGVPAVLPEATADEDARGSRIEDSQTERRAPAEAGMNEPAREEEIAPQVDVERAEPDGEVGCLHEHRAIRAGGIRRRKDAVRDAIRAGGAVSREESVILDVRNSAERSDRRGKRKAERAVRARSDRTEQGTDYERKRNEDRLDSRL